MKDKIFKNDSTNMGSDKPRGFRNNNPLNLRRTSIEWKGEKSEVTDPEFEEFETLQFGLRAGLINIKTNLKRGNDTIGKLISVWAPPSENNTSNYIKIVSDLSGIEPSRELKFDKDQLFLVVSAMCKIESGLKLKREIYEEAWSII